MDIAKFIETVSKLKDVKRAGFAERGVKDPESVADHSFMASVMAMVIPVKGVDKERVMKMLLVHDIAESEIGDLITKDNWPGGGSITSSEKMKIEFDAMKKITSILDKSVSAEIMELFEEFVEVKTPEAILAKDLDTAEMLIQAYGYHKKGNFKTGLTGFWDERNMGSIRNENIKRLVSDIIGKGR